MSNIEYENTSKEKQASFTRLNANFNEENVYKLH